MQSITGSAVNNLRFPGQYFLIESGLHYNWHRHYDPTIGRYLQADPLGFVNGPSLFAYAVSAPTMYVDPEGRFVPIVWLGSVAAGAAVAAAIDIGIQLYKNDWKLSCVNPWQVAGAAAGGALLAGLGPEGFLLGRGGLRAAQYGYPEISGLLNHGANRFGWGFNQKLDANVLRGVFGGKKFDIPGIAVSPYPSALRSGIPGGAISGTGSGVFWPSE